MENNKEIQIGTQDVDFLEDAYQEALEKDQETFIYKGKEVDTGYAKHLIEFLKTTKNE